MMNENAGISSSFSTQSQKKVAVFFPFYFSSLRCEKLSGWRSREDLLQPSDSPPYLLASHQEEVHSSNVDVDVLAEVLQDLPYERARAEGDGGAGAVRKHHAALTGRSLPCAHRVAIITLDVRRIHVHLVLWQLFNIDL